MRPPGAADVPTLQVRARRRAGADRPRRRGGARLLVGGASDAAPADALELRRRAAEQLLRAGHVDDGLQAMAPVLAAVELQRAGDAARAR